MSVTLINAFEVPASEEATFLEKWQATSDQAKLKSGFVETLLHRALKDDARFLFVNVAVWESEELYHAAFKDIDIHEDEDSKRACQPGAIQGDCPRLTDFAWRRGIMPFPWTMGHPAMTDPIMKHA